MAESVVTVERLDAVLVVTVNRTAQRNAVDRAVADSIAAAMAQLDASPELAVGILTGAGGNFSAGMDLKAFAAGERGHVPERGFAGLVEKPPCKPLVAAVEGWALGGGFEIALACDLIVAGQEARFGLPEVRRGVAARGGGAFRLPRRLPHSIAMEVLLTGEVIGAPRLYDLGLVNRLTPTGGALEGALELARLIARNAPLSVMASKYIAYASSDWDRDQAFGEQARHLEPVFASDDAMEGARAFAERRAPIWSGH